MKQSLLEESSSQVKTNVKSGLARYHFTLLLLLLLLGSLSQSVIHSLTRCCCCCLSLNVIHNLNGRDGQVIIN